MAGSARAFGAWSTVPLLLLVLLSLSVHEAAAQQTPTIEPCTNPPEALQVWEFDGSTLRARAAAGSAVQCLTADAAEKDAGLHLANCSEPPGSLQLFHHEPITNAIVATGSQLVLDVSGYSNSSGARLHLWTRTGRGNQQWDRQSDGRIVGHMSGLCLTASSIGAKPCSLAANRGLPFCNASLTPAARAADLVARIRTNLTLLGLQLAASAGSAYPGGIPALHIPAPTYSEALHGAVCGCHFSAGRNGTVCPSSFPHALALAASLNTTLFGLVGDAIGLEARALHNVEHCGPFLWSPDINLIRDPRWGRAMEVPGEDPLINSEYAARYIHSLQYGRAPAGPSASPSGAPPYYQRMLSQPKHLAVYNLEGHAHLYPPRPQFNAIVSDHDLAAYYLVPWRSAVQKGVARGAMCSVNAINGVPSCANKRIMQDVMRASYGLDGMIVTDGGACYDPNYQKYIGPHVTPELATAVCLESGVDVELGNLLYTNVNATVQAGLLNASTVENAVAAVFTQMIRAATFDTVPELDDITVDAAVDTPAHRTLAREAAEQAMVLLKNEGGLLPLAATQSVALIGPHANATQIMLSNYYGENLVVQDNSPLQAFQRSHGARVLFEPACDLAADGCASLPPANLERAKQAAAEADVALVFVGLYPIGGGTPGGGDAREAEGWDRVNITLPGQQNALVQAVLAANKRTVVVMMSGGQVAISDIKASVPAIVQAFYPGEMGGPALYNVLSGASAVGGRLPYTMYDSAYTSCRNMTDASLAGGCGTTYMYYQGPPVLWPFGFGMYYTAFALRAGAAVSLTTTTAALAAEFGRYYEALAYVPPPALVANVTLDNTAPGAVASPCTVSAYAVSPQRAPFRRLLGFTRLARVEAGATPSVGVGLVPIALVQTDATGRQFFAPGTIALRIDTGEGTAASAVDATLTITGPSVTVWQLPPK